MTDKNSTAIQPFTYAPTNQSINFVKEDDESIWSLGVELCKILGTDSKDIPNILEPDEFKYLKRYYRGQVRRMIFISEPGMWRLITCSRKPIAKKIQRWMFHEVFPTIRKTGSYGHKPQLEFDPNDLGHVQSILAALSVQSIQDKATIEALEVKTAKITTRVIAAKAKIAAQTPVVDAYKRLAASEGSMNITEAAKNLKIPPTELTNYMLDAKWLYMRPPSTRKIAYQTKIKKGWMESEPFSKDLGDGRTYMSSQPKVTGTGLIRLARELNIVLTEPPQ